ncbi:MAG: phosphoadenosine phosphosulfate reductase family protein [Granulosicoccus sp.]
MPAAIQHTRYSADSTDSSPFQRIADETLTCVEHSLKSAIRPVASTKFSPDSAVFLHMLTRISPDIPIVWVDTGYNTRDTLLFATHLTETLGLNLITFRPANAQSMEIPEIGTPAHDAFTFTMKLEPFQRAFKELQPDLWLSSLRRFQSSHRDKLSARETISPGLVKSYPMLEWSADAVELYRQKHALPSGPDVYDPTKGLPQRECGLHTRRWCATDSTIAQVAS